MKTVQELFWDGLLDLRDSERETTRELENMAEMATRNELKNAIQAHLTETEQHLDKLEHLLGSLKPIRSLVRDSVDRISSSHQKVIRAKAADANDAFQTANYDLPQLELVRFQLRHPTATSVSVAGTFNDWHPTSHAMSNSGGGLWTIETVLPPGVYEYCLVVDGHWMPDPMAPDHLPNPYGGGNSIVHVPSRGPSRRSSYQVTQTSIK